MRFDRFITRFGFFFTANVLLTGLLENKAKGAKLAFGIAIVDFFQQTLSLLKANFRFKQKPVDRLCPYFGQGLIVEFELLDGGFGAGVMVMVSDFAF